MLKLRAGDADAMTVQRGRTQGDELLGPVGGDTAPFAVAMDSPNDSASVAPFLEDVRVPLTSTQCSLTLFKGIPVDDLTLAEAVQRCDEFVRRGRSSGRSHQVATVNVEFLVNAGRDNKLRSILQKADLSVPDGMPLVWGSRLLRAPLRQRVSGADLVPALAELCGEKDYKLMFFGAGPGVAEAAAARLRLQHPRLNICAVEGPQIQISGAIDMDVVNVIRSAAPDVLCVALGNPKQEHWISQYRGALGVPVLVGVGGTLDFLAGAKVRAPLVMQRTGTEWMFRLLYEPRRLFGRYAKCFGYFFPMMCQQLWVVHGVEHRVRETGEVPVGPLVRSGVAPDRPPWTLTETDREAVEDSDVIVDLTHLQGLDRTTVSSLFFLHRLNASVTLVGVSPRAMRSLLRQDLGDVFVVGSVSTSENL